MPYIVRLPNGRIATDRDGKNRVWFDRKGAQKFAEKRGGVVEEVK